jgi:hypothetical protein
VLSADESRHVRAVARHGRRVRLTVTTTPGDGAQIQVATATAAVTSSSLPPVSDCYTDREGSTRVYLRGDAVTSVLSVATDAWWSVEGGSAPLMVSPPPGGASWAADGTYDQSADFGQPSSGEGPMAGTFSADGTSGTIDLNPGPDPDQEQWVSLEAC